MRRAKPPNGPRKSRKSARNRQPAARGVDEETPDMVAHLTSDSSNDDFLGNPE
jgi:hypothetical protein